MNDPFKSLRDEAGKMAEPFSPALHARVMAAAERAPQPTAAHSFPKRWHYAAAAAILLALGIAFVPIRNQPGHVIAPPPPAPAQLATGDVAAFNDLITIAAAPVRQNLKEMPNQTYAYLDDDAARFAKFMGRQLDQIPTLPR